jgi:putative transposase
MLAIGGMPDHIHILLSMPAVLSLSKTVQLLKGNSSQWIRATFEDHSRFEWQRGYGAGF